jgi:molybdate transport system regulatory protein
MIACMRPPQGEGRRGAGVRRGTRNTGAIPVRPRLKVWVVFSDRVKFGDGRAELLRLVDELGSLKEAVARSGMSYRSAWGYLLELEQAAGTKLLERRRGSGATSGTKLTREGRTFLERYRRFRAGLDRLVLRDFRKAFPHS